MLKNAVLKHNYYTPSNKNKSLILKIVILIRSNTVQTSNFTILIFKCGNQILDKNSSNKEDLPKNILSCSQKFLDGRRAESFAVNKDRIYEIEPVFCPKPVRFLEI